MSYSENQLTALAKSNPKELIRIITSPNSDVHALTFGAEILGGEVVDESLVLPALRRLLKHVNAIVREGAMNGLSAFYQDRKPPQDVLDRLQKMAVDDPSPDCKNLAVSLLEDYNK
jgi:vesicle coat complex subunit